ncbi:serine hydrolase domain-containing protein [Cellulomonas sp. 179-A 4D5 NHS]|uniref:serine hydrolase domain-containing protein n=1 Tax=Cellulomonas sp. 179-A 4D5 NHS TaxID=3142378 RepID=UPI0039A36C9D
MPPGRLLLPRSTPAAAGVSSRALTALLDRLEAAPVECHSLVVVRHGRVVAEGWWAPYSAERPHLLYSLTKTFTAVAVGLAVTDGLLALDDRVVDVLPDHVPADAPDQAHRLTVHHLLTMTTGRRDDSLDEAWALEPRDLVKGFLRVPFPDADTEGTPHAYDNATTFVLARMVERVTGRGLDEMLDERLFAPMGVEHAEWDRVAGGAVYGFHGLHLTTEAVAAFGELLLGGGRWGDRQLVPRDWVERATRHHVDTVPYKDDASHDADFACGYGYQIWMSRHGFHGHGAYGQQCVVVPSHDLVVAVTAEGEAQVVLDALWECLLPGLDDGAASPAEDAALAERLDRLALAPVEGSADPGRSGEGTLAGAGADSPLPGGTRVTVDTADGGWLLRLGPSLPVDVGHGEWRESAPLGRPVVASGGWRGDTFVADLRVVTTPHRVRVVVDPGAGTATATWSTVPLPSPLLERHLRAPLSTRPEHG